MTPAPQPTHAATGFSPIPDILDDLRAGRLVILVDDEQRENEGDLVCAASCASPELINFMIRKAAGKLCLALAPDICDRLNLYPQTPENTAQHGTAFTVSIDAARQFGVTTGVSAADRCATIQRCIAPDAQPQDFHRPGHISPLRAREGGVLVRAGHTEASVDLARLAGLEPAGVIIEILREDGEVARLPDLIAFARTHHLKIATIADLVEFRLQREQLVRRVATIPLKNEYGQWTLIAYESCVDDEPHLALCMGGIGEVISPPPGAISPPLTKGGPGGFVGQAGVASDTQASPASGETISPPLTKGGPGGVIEQGDHGAVVEHPEPVLVRVHSQCLTGDVFGSARCDCGDQLHAAMHIIAAQGRGVIVYLRQEGRGIGLLNKLHAYRLQDEGLDTVEANEKLGFPADKRDYGVGAQILRDLGIRRIRILTNNPKKISRLEVYGLEVVEQRPLEIPPSPDTRRYLQAKRRKLGHTLREV